MLRAVMLALRDDFLLRHPRPEELSLLTGERDPFLAGLGRSQMDYPNELGGLDVNLIGSQLVAAIRARPGHRGSDSDTDTDAKARAIALMALQIAYGVFGPLFLKLATVDERDQADVELGAVRLSTTNIRLAERPINDGRSS